MINIVCVKIGTKYDSSYANRLFEMCRSNITTPFKFICYTDDNRDLHPEITAIPYVDNNIKVIVFNKLYLLSDEFASLLPNTDPCVFFDLDMVIKSNIDAFIAKARSYDGAVRVINAVWKRYYKKDFGPPIFDHTINSSCMVWKPYKNNHIWKRFNDNKQYYQDVYHRGMDCFLYYECRIRGGLPEDMFYSYLLGIDRKVYRVISSPEDYQKIRRSTPIVLFNGPTTDDDIQQFIESGYEKEYVNFAEFFYASKEQRDALNKAIEDDFNQRLAK